MLCAVDRALGSFHTVTHTQMPTCSARHVAAQVEKQCAKFFTMHVDQDTIDQGFIIAAHSPALSKFKLLLFEQAPDGHQWELVRQVRAMVSSRVSSYATVCCLPVFGGYPPPVLMSCSTHAQEDSTRMRKVTAAALFFLQLPTVTIGSAPSPLETGGDLEQARARHGGLVHGQLSAAAVHGPSAQRGCHLRRCGHMQVLFKRLQGVRPRETVPLKPGAILFAVYCDNWCELLLLLRMATWCIAQNTCRNMTSQHTDIHCVQHHTCRFKRATFTLEALSPAQLTADACGRVQQVDQQLLERKQEVSAFEAEFRKVSLQWLADDDMLQTAH